MFWLDYQFENVDTLFNGFLFLNYLTEVEVKGALSVIIKMRFKI